MDVRIAESFVIVHLLSYVAKGG